MAGRAKRKRPFDFEEEDDPPSQPMERKPRFPKGKKVKREVGELNESENAELDVLLNPAFVSTVRAKRHCKIGRDDLFRENIDISADEINYDESADLEDDGIPLEPFNLKQEREEGYFDANGNYVEFVSQNETKDAWLDSVVVDPSYTKKHQKKAISDEEEYRDLSTEDIGKIKRSIANILLPGETIIQALKRLKGTSGDKKTRMPEGTKRMFDQLTEGAMKLMENGEYNVYNEEREIFEREAEGYERIARARAGTSGDGDDDQYDVSGGDEDDNNVNVQSNANAVVSEQAPQPGTERFNLSQELNSGEASNGVESDFVYDASSGYYYSSSLGYYYDPASTLYCSATSGNWYEYNEQSGEYVECQNSTAVEN